MIQIRDFIYLDVEKLYSLYSQVFEGVADRIIQSYIGSLQSTESSKGRPFLPESDSETQVVEVSRRTENKFLYDYMYNRLEERISEAIVDASGVTEGNYQNEIGGAFIIKVAGSAEIEDFNRMRILMQEFNNMGQAMHYITTFNREQARVEEKKIEELKARVENTKDKNARIVAEKALENALQNRQQVQREAAMTQGLAFDSEFLARLSYLTDLFNSDRFDVTIVPRGSSDKVAFRGVLDKKWLRVAPNFLAALYSGIAANWIMVGQVTQLPTSLEKDETANRTDESSNKRSVRDAYQAIIRQGYEVEKTFTLSKIRTEVIMSPLAIYRERSLAKGQS